MQTDMRIVSNKKAPLATGAVRLITQSIRTRFLRLFPCTPRFLIALLPEHTATSLRIVVFVAVRISVRTARTFRDCEKPAKVPTAASQESDSRCQKAMVGRVIAASRTPPWLASGWGYRGSAPFRRAKKSLWQPHALQQINVARVRVERFESAASLDGL